MFDTRKNARRAESDEGGAEGVKDDRAKATHRPTACFEGWAETTAMGCIQRVHSK